MWEELTVLATTGHPPARPVSGVIGGWHTWPLIGLLADIGICVATWATAALWPRRPEAGATGRRRNSVTDSEAMRAHAEALLPFHAECIPAGSGSGRRECPEKARLLKLAGLLPDSPRLRLVRED